MSWEVPPRRTEAFIAHPEDLADLFTRDLIGYTVNDVLCVFSVQKAMNDISGKSALVLDGVFGNRTREVVQTYQRNRGLAADGIAGPKTSARIIKSFLVPAAEVTGAPIGLPDGQVAAESGELLGAVNWSVKGGVDLSSTQRRVLGPPYDRAALKRAFDTKYQVGLLCSALKDRYLTFVVRPGVVTPRVLSYIPTRQERAWRLAALWHNYQTAADYYSRYPDHRSSYWTSPQEWTKVVTLPDGSKTWYRFDDGAFVKTPFEWSQFYALSNPAHREPGLVCERVVDWTP